MISMVIKWWNSKRVKCLVCDQTYLAANFDEDKNTALCSVQCASFYLDEVSSDG